MFGGTTVSLGKSDNGITWISIVLLVLAVSGFIWGTVQKKNADQYKRELVKQEFAKFKPINDSIDSIDQVRTITLDDIIKKKDELAKLEAVIKKSQQTDPSVITKGLTLEEALKIIEG